MLPPRYEARSVHGIRFITLSDEVSGHEVEAPGHTPDRDLVRMQERARSWSSRFSVPGDGSSWFNPLKRELQRSHWRASLQVRSCTYLVMSDAQQQWFWNELASHRGKGTPIFLFTHQPHPEFAQWPKLKEVLGKYNIVAWFSGHKHRWDIRDDSGEGFIQVNIHSLGGVRENYLSSFLHLDRQDDTVEVTVRFRNHETQEWIEVDGKDRFTFSVELPGH